MRKWLLGCLMAGCLTMGVARAQEGMLSSVCAMGDIAKSIDGAFMSAAELMLEGKNEEAFVVVADLLVYLNVDPDAILEQLDGVDLTDPVQVAEVLDWAWGVTEGIQKNAEASTYVRLSGAISAERAILGAIDPTKNAMTIGAQFSRKDNVRTTEAMAAVASQGFNCGWEIWVSPFAVWANEDQKGRHPGYDADTYGVNLGVTKNFDKFYIGAVFGYGRTDVDAKGAHLKYESDNYSLAGYMGVNIANFKLDFTGGYTWSDYDDYRARFNRGWGNEQVHNNGFDGHAYFTRLRASYDFNLGCWAITPSVAWEYIHVENDAFNVRYTWDGASAYRAQKSKYYSSRLPVMLKVGRNFGSANVFVQGGYIREFNKSRTSAAYIVTPLDGAIITGFNAQGRHPARNFGTVGAGVNGSIGRWNLGLSYDYLWDCKDFDAHALTGRVGITF